MSDCAHIDWESDMRNDWAMQQAQDEGSADQGGSDRRIHAHEAVPHGGKVADRHASWMVEVIVDDSGEWESDPFRFGTLDEALAYARDLEFRWSAVRDRRVVKSLDPVNRSWPRNRAGGRRQGE
jgi:hypothetical protein